MLGVSLRAKTWVSKTATSRPLSGRAVAGDEDGGPDACEMSSSWTTVSSTCEGCSRNMTPLGMAGFTMGDDREPETVTLVGSPTVDSSLICRVAPMHEMV